MCYFKPIFNTCFFLFLLQNDMLLVNHDKCLWTWDPLSPARTLRLWTRSTSCWAPGGVMAGIRVRGHRWLAPSTDWRRNGVRCSRYLWTRWRRSTTPRARCVGPCWSTTRWRGCRPRPGTTGPRDGRHPPLRHRPPRPVTVTTVPSSRNLAAAREAILNSWTSLTSGNRRVPMEPAALESVVPRSRAASPSPTTTTII